MPPPNEPGPHEIQIQYATPPRGQVGPKPRKIPKGGMFQFTCNDPGVLTIEFIEDSPLASGSKTVGANQPLTADRSGNFKFKCSLEHDGETVTFGDPDDPESDPGGEIEIGPG